MTSNIWEQEAHEQEPILKPCWFGTFPPSCFTLTLTCIEQHFNTVGVIVSTSHMQRGPVVKVIRLQTSIRGNQELHTVCVSWKNDRKIWRHTSLCIKIHVRWLTHSPPMQASWRGEAVREVRAGLALAPCSSKSLTHSKLPAELASHSGVLPSTFLASTWEESVTCHRIIYWSTTTFPQNHISSPRSLNLSKYSGPIPFSLSLVFLFFSLYFLFHSFCFHCNIIRASHIWT